MTEGMSREELALLIDKVSIKLKETVILSNSKRVLLKNKHFFADGLRYQNKKWNASPAGKAAKARWNASPAGKAAKAAWNASPEGKAAKAAWLKTPNGQEYKDVCYLKAQAVRTATYLSRPFVAIDSEGAIPLEALFASGDVKPSFIKRDASGYPWRAHDLKMIGAAAILRPFGVSLADAKYMPPLFLSSDTRLATEQCLAYLVSLPEHFEKMFGGLKPIFVMFAAMYDWSMWLFDNSFAKNYEIVKERMFRPPCRRVMAPVIIGKYIVQMRPYNSLKIAELRWPDDPFGKKHLDDPAFNEKTKFQTVRSIKIYDTFRFSPKSFLKTIEPLMKRGLVAKDEFDTIAEHKEQRNDFHKLPLSEIEHYTSLELYSLCKFMHQMRDACWTAMGIKLKMFHSLAAAASEILRSIDVRSHSWPVTSKDLSHEQIIAHWAYFGGSRSY
jgi:hypothetical protein